MKLTLQLLTGLCMLLTIQQLSAQTTLIDPAGDGGFENGSSFSSNGWTEVNGSAPNIWVVGTAATGFSGNTAYVSNDNGTTNAYNINAGSLVHFYRDVTFPAGETQITLSFSYKGYGESSYDGLQVSIADITVNPTASTTQSGTISGPLVPGATIVGSTLYSIYSSVTTINITIPASVAGNTSGASTKRLIFSWANDASFGTQPPGGIDAMSLISSPPPPPPSNDDCAGATAFPTLPTDGTCATLSNQSTTNATNSNVTPTGACTSNSGNPDDDIWFSFVATSTTVIMSATYVSGSTDVYWQVFSSACGSSMTAILCTDTDAGGTITGLTIGNTYYIRLYTYFAAATTTQNICLKVPPVNDDCAGALTLTVSNYPTCSYTGINTTNASQSTSPSSTCFSTYNNDDLFYTFTTSAAGSYSFNYQNFVQTSGTATQVAFQLYQGNNCGSLTEVSGTCNLGYGSGGSGSVSYSLSASTTYYIRICASGSGNSASFDFCILSPAPPPSNDNCSGALAFPTIPTDGTCATLSNQSTASATNSNVTPTGACTSNSGTPDDDVWFSFVAPGPTVFLSATNVSGVTDVYWQVFSGACGSTMTAILCTDTDAGGTVTGLTTGNTYYIRLYTYSSGATTTQNICLKTPPPNDECSGAVQLTVYNNATCGGATNGTTVNATSSLSASPCAGTADDDVWFSFVATACSHTITVVGGSTFDAVVNLRSGACNGSSIACADATASGGTETITGSGLTIGATYYVRVWSYTSASGQGTFTICVTTPLPMTYVSSTTTQPNTGGITAGTTGNDIIRLEVTVINSACALSVSQVQFNTSGTTSNADITNAKVYYTGTSSTFSTTTLFGTAIANPGTGTLAFNGSQVLTGGSGNTVNYFWLAYDVSTCAANGDVLDGQSVDFTISGGSPIVPAVTNPAGSRTVTGASGTFTSIANGPWSSGATWGGCPPPSGVTQININTNVTLDNSYTYPTANLTINTGGTLTINSNTLVIGPSGGGNKSLSVTGTLTIGGGTLEVDGSVLFNSNSTFNMSGGSFNIDGNSGSSGTSVASGTRLLAWGSTGTGITINANGGTITIVDPPFTGTALSAGISISSSNTQSTSFLGNTLQFGDGSSAQAGTSSGFIFDTYVSTKNIPFGNVIVNAGNGATRFVSGTTSSADASDIQGSLTVNSGCEIRSASSRGIGVYGNIVNNGTISITSGSSGVLFMGGAQVGSAPGAGTAQTISGSGTWRNSTTSSTANINSLTINNSGGVTLQVPLTIGNTLTLTSGILYTSAANYIGVGTGISPAGTIGTSTISGGSGGSHVVGPVLRAIPSATTWATITDQRGLFPVGDGTTYRPVNLAVTTAVSSPGALSGQHITTDPGVPATPYADGGINIETTSPTGYWNVSYANGAAGGVFNVQVNATGFTKRPTGTISSFSNLRLIKRPTGGNWTSGADGTPVAPAALTAILRNGCTTFSDFAVGGTFTALPVELVSFSGKVGAHTNLLNWTVASEKNVEWYVVERSSDGIGGWHQAGQVASKGDSQNEERYALEDLAPVQRAYYRLRSVDFDGAFQLSHAIQLIRPRDGFGITALYPSPATDLITLGFSSLQEEMVTIRITDPTGRQVLEDRADAFEGANTRQLPIGHLSAGLYFVTISGSTGYSEPAMLVKN
jgi:hypothetical protein